MDAINELGVDTLVMMIASQLGKTEIMLNILGYFVDQDPSPILLVYPTIDTVKAFSRERIDPTFRASPVLRGKLVDGHDGRGSSRKSEQTIRLKFFPGGYLAMSGSNSAAGLSSRPIRVVICDEVDRFEVSAGTEGDPISLAFQRTSNFEHNRKRVLVSSPGIDGASKIQEWYGRGDQRQFLVPCPHCGEAQVLKWEHVVYKNEAGERDFKQTHYICAVCKRRIEEREKWGMLAAGKWVAQVPGGKDGTGKIVSFGDLSALYSPWTKWSTLAEEWCAAHDARNRELLKAFVNLRLGQPFVEHDQTITDEAVNRHRSQYDCEVPADVMLLTAGVDVQDDRLEVEVVGWGAGRQSWGIKYLRLTGDPGAQEVWQQLEAVLTRAWPTKDGRNLVVVCACVDSQGHHTDEVYSFCHPREQRRVLAIRGGKDPLADPVSKPSRNNRWGCALYTLNVHNFKNDTWSRLMLEHTGPGYCHWPVDEGRGYDVEYFSGFLSERLIKKQVAGHWIQRWFKTKEHTRNEPWDCRIYATAALHILAPDPSILDRLFEQARAGGGSWEQQTAAPRNRRRGSPGITV